MTEQDRVAQAIDVVADAEDKLYALDKIPDPVQRRRRIVGIARDLRAAANTLDQNGFLTE